MENKHTTIRELSPIEQAFTISNEAMPLCVVCVLHLSTGPTIQELREALSQLQSLHPLLRAGIKELKGKLVFNRLDPGVPVSLTVIERHDAESWRNVAEKLLNTKFNKDGPLMKCVYLPGEEKENSELMVCFHHSIIDGASARLILHELLSFAGKVPLPELSGRVENRRLSKWGRKAVFMQKLLAFALRQGKEEWVFKKRGVASPIPEGSENAIISLRLPPAFSRTLSLRAGREGFSLNTLLLAAITQATQRCKHPGMIGQVGRVISFASLREMVRPADAGQQLGCYISMLRLLVPLNQDQSIYQLARHIRQAMFRASRGDEVFIMSRISKYLIRMVLKRQNQRLGLSALSFIGKLDLEPEYGAIRLRHVSAFITNNRFGPEFSAFGMVLFGSICLDFTYLVQETSPEKAGEIVGEVRKILEKVAEIS